jgi:peptidyl-prolyl cis-trans isomerase D
MLSQMRANAKYIWYFVVAAFIIGFLLYQTSGLAGRTKNTASTTVFSVNGQDITYIQWSNATQRRYQEAQQRAGRALTLDEQKELEQQTYDEMVSDILLEQEYQKRGIGVSDEEIREAAQTNPPQAFLQAPELQTDGRFDPEKYQRYLSSPGAKQSGLLLQLEAMYRDQIPKEKLFEQVASSVYVTDAQLWSLWRDGHDSAQISYVSWHPDAVADSTVHVTDEAIHEYFVAHKKQLGRKGRASVSILILPRTITSADTAATRAHLLALRDQIEKGAKFDDVAKRESQDSASAAQGGLLGTVTRGRFVPQFDSAAFALKPGELSQPVLSPYGFHLIRVDSKKGDSITVRHILLRIQQSDSAAARTNHIADSLDKIVGHAELSGQFDKAAKTFGLPVVKLHVNEDEPLIWNGRQVPSVGTWAFSGAQVGESSELFDADDAYYLARLDSLTPGVDPNSRGAEAAVRPQIRAILARRGVIELLRTKAQIFADAAVKTSFDAEAKAEGLSVIHSPSFNRTAFVPDVGRFNEVIGAAFSLPLNAVSAPIATDDAMYVIRVDKRIESNRAAWEAQKVTQRQSLMQQQRDQAIQIYLANLRDAARIVDNRKAIEAANRQQSST